MPATSSRPIPGADLRKLLGAIVVLTLYAAPSLAADMPVKAPPLAAPVFDWTGWYVGGNFGLGWARAQEGTDPPFMNGLFLQPAPACAIVGPGLTAGKDCVHPLHGFIGGGQTGYNWQRGNWVYGVEASFSASEIAGTEVIFAGDSNTFSSRIRTLLLAEGRLGYAWDRTLLYAKAGYAGGSVRTTLVGVVGGDSETVTAWHNGWTVGAGVEYAFAPNWIFGVEYDFADLGSQKRTGTASPSGIQMPISSDIKELHLALLRLSYKFGSR